MNLADLIQAASAAILLFAGALHLMVGLWSVPRNKVHLSFGVVSLVYGVYSLGIFFLYATFDSGSLSHYLFTDKWGLATLYIGYAALFWFITFYTNIRSGPFLWIITVLYVLIALSNFFLPYTWIYTGIELTDSFPPEIIISPWYRFELLTTYFLIIGYSIYCAIGQYRRGEGGEVRALSIAVGIFLATYIYDIFIEFGIIDTLLIQQYGFVAFVVVMSMHLASEAVEAMRGYRLLTRELEQRIDERTKDLSVAKNEAEAALEELQESETRMDYVLRSTRMAVWEYDLQTRESAVTDMFPFLLGYEPDDLLVESDKKWRPYQIGHQALATKLLNPEDAERYGEVLGGMIEGNETFEVEYRLRMADGQWNWMRDYGKIVKWDDSGKPLVAYGVVMDNDKIKKLQLELIDARDAAEAANRAKSVFLANMSHELRTPLNAILGHAQIMSRSTSLQPNQRIAVKAISKSGDHLQALINSVLEMSKIEAGQAVLTPSCFSIDSILTDIVVMFHDRVRQKGLELSVEKDPDVVAAIEADRGKIIQILINLLSNAVRYTSSGNVFLRAGMTKVSDDRSQLSFEVEDQGPGIAADKLKKIFEPFIQIDDNSKQQSGTGLGLAISRQFAELMGGNLTAESREGQGSIFRLMIPVIEARSPPMEMESSPSRRIAGIAGEWRDIKVLVVDDDPANREVLLGMMMPLGFEVQEAVDGREAVDVFVDWSPNLILMDIRMPVMDGIEAIQTIKSLNKGKSTSIIGVSASVFEEDRHKVLESGADDFIAKPIQEAELWEKIEQCLKVEFIYETKEQAEVDRLEAGPLAIEDISELPDELVQEMRAAIQGGYMDRLAELAGRAADRHPQLSRHILKLVDRYDFDSLSRLFLEKDYSDEGN